MNTLRTLTMVVALVASGEAAAAGCPSAPTAAWVSQNVDRMIGAVSGEAPVSGPDAVYAVLSCRFALNPAEMPQALSTLGLDQTGGRTDAPLAFGDVAWEDGWWVFYLEGSTELAVEATTGRASFVRSDARRVHYRLAESVSQAWEIARHDQGLSERLQAAVQEHGRARLASLASEAEPTDGQDQPPREERPGFRGLQALNYTPAAGVHFGPVLAVGDQVGRLSENFLEGGAWISAGTLGPMELRAGARYGRVDDVPTSAWQVDGEFSMQAARGMLDLRLNAPQLGPLSFGVQVGPSLSVFSETITLQGYEQAGRELVIGGQGSADLTLWFGREAPTGVYLRGEGALHRQRAPGDPLTFLTAHAGLTFRGDNLRRGR